MTGFSGGSHAAWGSIWEHDLLSHLAPGLENYTGIFAFSGASDFQSKCNPFAIQVHRVCNPNAIHLQSKFAVSAIQMQSICNPSSLFFCNPFAIQWWTRSQEDFRYTKHSPSFGKVFSKRFAVQIPDSLAPWRSVFRTFLQSTPIQVVSVEKSFSLNPFSIQQIPERVFLSIQIWSAKFPCTIRTRSLQSWPYNVM